MCQDGGKVISGYVELDQVADNIRLSVLDARTGQIVNSMDLGPQIAGEVGFDWNGGNFDGEAAPNGDYVFQAEVINGNQSRGLLFGQTRVQGVSFNDELGQVLLEISDGQTAGAV